jgi:hypothetical protein
MSRTVPFSSRRVAAPLFLGGLPFAPLSHANGGSFFSGSVLSIHRPLFTTHCSLLTIHCSLASYADRLERTQTQDPPSKTEDESPGQPSGILTHDRAP